MMNEQIDRVREIGSYHFEPIELKAMLDRYSAFSAYYSSLRRKYEYAASLPWRDVPPDPPKPLGSPTWPIPELMRNDEDSPLEVNRAAALSRPARGWAIYQTVTHFAAISATWRP